MRTPLAEPAERGRLDIHPTVLRKIVEHAADSVPGTLRHERRDESGRGFRGQRSQSARCVASGCVLAAVWSGWSSVAVSVVSGSLRLRWLTVCALALTAAAT